MTSPFNWLGTRTVSAVGHGDLDDRIGLERVQQRELGRVAAARVDRREVRLVGRLGGADVLVPEAAGGSSWLTVAPLADSSTWTEPFAALTVVELCAGTATLVGPPGFPSVVQPQHRGRHRRLGRVRDHDAVRGRRRGAGRARRAEPDRPRGSGRRGDRRRRRATGPPTATVRVDGDVAGAQGQQGERRWRPRRGRRAGASSEIPCRAAPVATRRGRDHESGGVGAGHGTPRRPPRRTRSAGRRAGPHGRTSRGGRRSPWPPCSTT